jgi:protocatechuate 3,4-dioxygenase beta subunit
MDNNITRVQGAKKKPKGDSIYMHGKVFDKEGKTVERAVVEIWQTDNNGIYNHAGDQRQAGRDLNFQFFGRSVTDKNGRYVFKTIKPAAYGVRDDWRRPPHIHYKVYRRGFEDLTTQLYFAGDPLNEKDGIYNNVPKKDRPSVTIEFQASAKIGSDLAKSIADEFGQKNGLEKEATVGQFDIVINAVA